MAEDRQEADVCLEHTVRIRSEAPGPTCAAVTDVSHGGRTAVRSVAADGQGKSIDDLPDEIMLDIFSFFSFNELIDIMQNVCVRWKRLAQDPVLWRDKEYVIRGRAQNGRRCCGVICSECFHCRCEKTDREVWRSAGMMPQLRTLTMMRGTKVRILRKICRNCPNLTTLLLHGCQKMSYSLLKYIFEKCPKIQKLIIASSLLADQRYAEMVSRLEDLRSLEVFDNRKSTRPIMLRFLGDACPRLQEINLYWDCHPLEDVEYFVKAKRDTLTSATMRWTMAGKRCIVPVLREAASSLEHLRLYTFDVAPEEEAEVLTALGELHNLRQLHLDQLTPRRSHLISLAFRLDLSGCSGLGGSAMAHIAQLPALHTLILQSIEDLRNLQPSLRNILDLNKLQCLDILYCNHIDALPFDEFPGRLINLRELHVRSEEDGEDFCAEVFDELQHQMPQLRIIKTFRWTEEDFLTDYESDNDDDYVGYEKFHSSFLHIM